jgi:hypothetical protein
MTAPLAESALILRALCARKMSVLNEKWGLLIGGMNLCVTA